MGHGAGAGRAEGGNHVKAIRPGGPRCCRRHSSSGSRWRASCSAGRRSPCPRTRRRRVLGRAGDGARRADRAAAAPGGFGRSCPRARLPGRRHRAPGPEGRAPVGRRAPRHDDGAHGARREHPGAHRRHEQHGGRAAGLSLRLGSGGPGGGRRSVRRGGGPRGGAGTRGRAGPAQRHHPAVHRRRGARPARRPGVRRTAPLGEGRAPRDELRGPGHPRARVDVRDQRRQRRGRGRMGLARPEAGRLVADLRSLQAPSERHRLHRVQEAERRRAELRVRRRAGAVSTRPATPRPRSIAAACSITARRRCG